MEVERKVLELINEPVKTLGIDIDSVTYTKEDGNYYLRIIIEKAGSVTIDDCVTVSQLINPIIDEATLEIDNYILDVCSK